MKKYLLGGFEIKYEMSCYCENFELFSFFFKNGILKWVNFCLLLEIIFLD